MKVLGVDGGGRGHAIGWKLAQSPHVSKLWFAPGNVGIVKERLLNGTPVECVPIKATDIQRLLAFALEKKPDLTIVGQDDPLVLGVVDLFEENGLCIWGPNKTAARFESSKIFSQQFMWRHHIPTPKAGWFREPHDAIEFAKSLDGDCFIKLDGLALGKGAIPSRSVEEAERIITDIFTTKNFGTGGEGIVIQKRYPGVEVSLHLICDGNSFKLFPTSQDHKQASEGGTGKNTGGMGAFSPTNMSQLDLIQIRKTILEPWLNGCQKEGIFFRGILYPGIMLGSEGPKVLEFNARFGDPEAQVYLTRMKNDLAELIEYSMSGSLDKTELLWKPDTSVCVVMASGGYPDSKTTGKVITGIEEANALPNTKVFHAGTALNELGEVVTSGGRVLGVTSWNRDPKLAVKQAYEAVDKIHFDTAWWRTDIGNSLFY